MRIRDRAYRRLRGSRPDSPSRPELLANYRQCRDAAKASLIAAKRSYLHDCIVSCRGSQRAWAELRRLGLIKSRRDAVPITFSPDELNSAFSSVFTTSHPSTQPHFPTPPSPRTIPRFTFSTVTSSQVSAQVLRSTSNSVGPDGLPASYLRLVSHLLLPRIVGIVNMSFTSATFPSAWRRSYITPIPKSPSPSSPLEFRPISILCALSKVAEGLAHAQLLHWLQTHDLLDPLQAGFKRGHSTQTALLKFTDDVRLGMDKRQLTVAVFFDFSKAFDTVSHTTLLHKLSILGLAPSALRWFESYLCGRSQAVRLPDGRISEWASVTSGVPQGSVLGPLLFSLYLYDLPGIFHHAQYLLYADDLVIYVQCSPDELADAIELLNADIARIHCWAALNNLVLNASKTDAMVLGTARYLNQLDLALLPPLSVSGQKITFVDHKRYLGVVITPTLSWGEQVSSVRRRVFGALAQLNRAAEELDVSSRAWLARTIVLPHLDYCSAVLCDVSGQQNLQLQRASNAAVRYALRMRRRDHVSAGRRALGWLSVVNRRKYFIGSLYYAMVNTGTPGYLAQRLLPRARTDSRAARGTTYSLSTPVLRTSAYRKSFAVGGTFLWNELPTSVAQAPTAAVFKKRLLEHLTSRESGDT